VSEDIVLPQFEATVEPTELDFDGRVGGDLRRLSAVPVDLAVEIGRTRMTVGETLELRQGSIIALDRMAGEPVDVLVNGALIARGEVVVIDEQFGLRVTEMLGAADLTGSGDALAGDDAAAADSAPHGVAEAPST
jgi:flagellar motor switch protein FliN/FliY